ncbi:hypothetical protein NIES39_K04750 [Arthrospira platensis NIES-39]|nr:hypothetical protein APPUASWS_020665 [Arthrospira platensis str. Paraca]BAI92120.1 hypothetical protein NIES39_K04750 [Arthrospira platensis NIES-39]
MAGEVCGRSRTRRPLQHSGAGVGSWLVFPVADRAPAPTGNFIPKNKKKIILAPPRHFFLGNPCFWAALLLLYYIMG